MIISKHLKRETRRNRSSSLTSSSDWMVSHTANVLYADCRFSSAHSYSAQCVDSASIRQLGHYREERNKTMLKKILAVLGIALGISTATEPSLVPFICMGVGLLMLTSEVEEWE